MTTIAPLGKYQAFDDNGNLLVGGKLYTYEAGTLTPKATYTTAAGTVANSNPVILDSSGYADVWLGDGGYKFRLDDADDNTIFVVDNIGGTSSTAFGENVMEISTNTAVTAPFANTAFIATAALTMSLLDAATAGEGFYFSVRNESAGSVTIDPDASQSINGGSTYTLQAGYSALVICNGTEWFTFFAPPLALIANSVQTTGTSGVAIKNSGGSTVATMGANNLLVTTLAGALNETQGATIASATTTDIGAATGNYVVVSGTTTITELGTIQAGTRRIVEFSGVLTLTHNATSLILPGGSNITTAAGDCATFVSEGSGNWRCVDYTKANGRALVATTTVFGTPLSQNPYANNTTVTQAHGLSATPTDLTVSLICLTGELGYSAGDIISLSEFCVNSGGASAISVLKDATNVTLITHVSAGPAPINKSTRSGGTSITPANWRILITPSLTS